MERFAHIHKMLNQDHTAYVGKSNGRYFCAESMKGLIRTRGNVVRVVQCAVDVIVTSYDDQG